jgi:dTDP-4-dehydrorhamnose reductase
MPQRWLVTGASGQLGAYVVRALAACPERPEVVAWHGRRAEATEPATAIDLADGPTTQRAAEAAQPTVILHLGAVTSVADCYRDPDHAVRVNVGGTQALARAATAVGARLVYVSTDMVFDGDAAPYAETDPPRPVSAYGRTKAAAEEVAAACPGSLVVRVPLMYGLPLTPRVTTFASQLAALRAGQPLRLFVDEFRTPVWLGDAARALIALARTPRTGVLHLGGPERLSRYDLIARCAELLGLPTNALQPVPRASVAGDEPRPADLSLDSGRLRAEFPRLVPGPLRAAALSD